MSHAVVFTDIETHIRSTKAATEWCQRFQEQEQGQADVVHVVDEPAEVEPMDQPDHDPIDEQPAMQSWGHRVPVPPQQPKSPKGTATVAPVTRPNATASQQANATFADPPSRQPTTITAAKRAAPEHEYIINIVTAGEIVNSVPRHRILWEASPRLLNWWGDLPKGFVFDSSRYVSREIQIQTGKSKKDIEWAQMVKQRVYELKPNKDEK